MCPSASSEKLVSSGKTKLRHCAIEQGSSSSSKYCATHLRGQLMPNMAVLPDAKLPPI